MPPLPDGFGHDSPLTKPLCGASVGVKVSSLPILESSNGQTGPDDSDLFAILLYVLPLENPPTVNDVLCTSPLTPAEALVLLPGQEFLERTPPLYRTVFLPV